MIFETTGQQPQSQMKQAQITSILAVKQFHPLLVHRTHAKIDKPQICQAARQEQSAQPRRVREMTFTNLKAATLDVGEKGLDMPSFLVHLSFAPTNVKR